MKDVRIPLAELAPGDALVGSDGKAFRVAAVLLSKGTAHITFSSGGSHHYPMHFTPTVVVRIDA